MDFAMYCFLQILLQFVIHSVVRKSHLRNFRKLANLRVHTSNVSSQKLILIKIGFKWFYNLVSKCK